MTQGYTCIFISFEQKLHIHEANIYKNMKTSVNEGIIKTRLYMYMNVYKWAMKHKQIRVNCCSLLVQV